QKHMAGVLRVQHGGDLPACRLPDGHGTIQRVDLLAVGTHVPAPVVEPGDLPASLLPVIQQEHVAQKGTNAPEIVFTPVGLRGDRIVEGWADLALHGVPRRQALIGFRGTETTVNLGGDGWESNPPESAPQPPNGFEDRAAHRDRTTPSNVISEAR